VEFHETGMGWKHLHPKKENSDVRSTLTSFLIPYEEPEGWSQPYFLTWDDGPIGGQQSVGPFDIVILNDGEPMSVSEECRTAYWIPKDKR
jgi:hypothetical protein